MLARQLAENVFGTSDSFVRLDMSEYMESHSVSKLIGSPPGYIGHDDKGQLTEKIKNRPYSLVLFDEIEKAHPDMFNILLQLFDEGKLTDSTGTEVNFRNTIIMMTSNIGTKEIINENSLGFASNTRTEEDNEQIILKQLSNHFRPELLNRIDEKIVFKALGKDEIFKIAELELSYVIDRLKEKKYKIKYSNDVIKYIAENGYDKKYGARPIKRLINSEIGNSIAQAILKNEINQKEEIGLIVDKKENKIN